MTDSPLKVILLAPPIPIPGGLKVGVELGAEDGHGSEVLRVVRARPGGHPVPHDGFGFGQGMALAESSPDRAEIRVGRLEVASGLAVENQKPEDRPIRCPLGGFGGFFTAYC